jgi:hypothetical protein
MTNILNWITRNPSAVAPLASAVIAASVALLVFAITQFLTHKRERTQFLTPKLEELYLLLNKVAEDNTRFFKLIYLSLEGSPDARHEIGSIDDLDLYGHSTAKRMIMYIRLYFPRLSRIHQLLFAAQRDLNQFVFQLHSETPPDLVNVVNASGRVGHFLRLMEEEIISNRDHLLGDYFIPRLYRDTTQDAIKAEIPPPDGPIMNLPDNS